MSKMKLAIYDSIKTESTSDIRTQRLHESIIHRIEEIVPSFKDRFTIHPEEKVKDPINKTGKFKVDSLIKVKSNKEFHTFILVKAPVSNVAQNEGNYAAAQVLDSIRLRFYHPNTNILFITICGNNPPYFKDKGKFHKIESPTLKALYNAKEMVNDPKAYSAVVRYDLDIPKFKNKIEFRDKIVKNSIKNIKDGEFNRCVEKIFGPTPVG